MFALAVYEEENLMTSLTTDISITYMLSVYVYALNIYFKTFVCTQCHTGNKFQEGK